MIGPKGSDGTYQNYFKSGSHPKAFPDVCVHSVYKEVESYLSNYGFKSPTLMTVNEIVKKIMEFQGIIVEGDVDAAAKTVSDTVAALPTR